MVMAADTGFVEMRLSKVVAVSSAPDDASFCVVLDAVSGGRRLPISIGPTEAVALSASLRGTGLPRPMSPQFAAGLVRALGGRVRQVRIDRLVPVHDGHAYGSTLELEGASGVESVDARPSDALNLVAVRPAPILVAPEVLADAEARMAGDSPEAAALRRALDSEQLAWRREPRSGHRP
jgi:hypothetical protein